jgi:tetratricopeptide (TPR) repeat protein
MTDDLTTRIHQRAEGNPFYAIELARLVEEGAVDNVPTSIRDAVRMRLRAVPAQSAQALTVAAVIGRDVELALLARTVGLPLGECVELLEPALAHRLLVPSDDPGSVRFSHALVREVLVDDLTVTALATQHLAVADAMAAAHGGDHLVPRDESEVFAEHLWKASTLGGADRAAAALERAAETAISRVAYTKAEETLGRAARLRRGAGSDAVAREAELTTLLRLLEVMQTTRYFAGTDRDVLHRAQELAATQGLEDVSRKLAWSEWAALSSSGHIPDALPLAEAFLDRWGEDERIQISAAAHVLVGIDEWTRGRIDSTIAHLDRSIAQLDEAPPPADAFEAEYTVLAHVFSLWAHAARGDMSVDDALAGFDALMAEVPPSVFPGVCSFSGKVSSVHGRWDALDRSVSRALDGDLASQLAFFGGQLLMQRGVVEAARGHLDEGVEAFMEGRRQCRAIGGRTMIIAYQSMVAEHLCRGGRVVEATEVVAGARRQFHEFGMAWEEIPLLVAEGVIAHASGDMSLAAERLATAVRVADDDGCHALARRAEATACELGVDLPSGELSPLASSTDCPDGPVRSSVPMSFQSPTR